MPAIKLLSNGKYHVRLCETGGGQSHWTDMAITRRREDASLDAYGTFLYVHDATRSSLWSVGAQPTCAALAETTIDFDRNPASFTTRCEGIEARMEVAVSADADLEWRRVRFINLSSQRRRLGATSLLELVLAPDGVDSAHPAFNKLFVVTAIDPKLGVVLATRRPSKPADSTAWVFHQAITRGKACAFSFESERMRFLGRGHSAGAPAALLKGEPLSGTAGSVLDPIAAIRAAFVLEPGGDCTVDWVTGVAASREDCIAMARRCRGQGYGDHVFTQADVFRRQTLQTLQAGEAEGRLYEALAGALLYCAAALRAPAETIAENERGQSSLWAYGISGDVPIVLLLADTAAATGAARHLVQAQAFWAAHGLKSELMIAAGTASSSDAALTERLRGAITEAGGGERLDKPFGVFVRDLAAIDPADRILLQSAARIVVAGSDGSLAEQVERAVRTPGMSTSQASAAMQGDSSKNDAFANVATDDGTGQSVPSDLVAFNGHGGFSADGREYIITASASHPTPLPWVNVIANAGFGTMITESGSATTWSENSHEFRLTPWSNDPVSDANTEAIYLRDEESGRFWSPTLLPTRSVEPYLVRHGFGYSIFEHAEGGIESTLRVHVDVEQAVKYSTLTIRNSGGQPRRVSATAIADWVLGDERGKNLMHVVTEYDESTGTIYARNAYNTDFAGRHAFFDVDVDGTPASSYGGDRGDFYGVSGSRAAPKAMREPELTGRFGAALDPCAVLRASIDLAPGEKRTIVFRLGAGVTRDAAAELVRSTRGQQVAQRSFEAVRDAWVARLGAVQVRTPDPTADALANGWLLYQVIGSRLWARTGYYQTSGAYGFRDQLQDVIALVHAVPSLVREHLLRAAARQFPEGDVQHWWHPPSGKGVRTRCSDDYLWLPFVASRYVDATGDMGVLDEACSFVESRLLKDGEASNYDLPKISKLSTSLYDHCQRAIRNGLRFGAHGLPLMGGGDWNDGMDLVGAHGRGESVWLAFFLITVLNRFAPLADQRGDTAFATLCLHHSGLLRERVEASAWDGAWYQRAWFDDGSPLGTAANVECQIDSIAQSWAVLSGAASSERARQAMQSVYDRLVRHDARIIELLAPPFNTSTPSPGYIAGYVPGVRENGGQYTHGATWTGMAFAKLGQVERAWEAFSMLDPTRHGDSAQHIARYETEPYVMAGDVYALAPHVGRGGWSWYTGSAGWMYQLLVESLLGLRRNGERLSLQPLIPAAWSHFEIRYRYKSATYEITVQVAASGADAGLRIDGVACSDDHVRLVDDGLTHAVIISVQRDGSASGRFQKP